MTKIKQFKLPTMLTVKETSLRTGLGQRFIRELARSNEIVHVSCGNKILINLEKFIEYLNSNTTSADNQKPVVDNKFGITAIPKAVGIKN